MCEAFKQGMTQRQGYVWFLPGWYAQDWYDVDAMRARMRGEEDEFMPNCTTSQMIEVSIRVYGGPSFRNGRHIKV